MSEKPNFHLVFLPTEFYLAIADVMSEMRVGKSSAILFMLGEGLRQHGFLDDAAYELYKARYSEPLLQKVRNNREARERSAKPKIRCMYGKGSSDKCRRIAVVTLKKGDNMVHSCPEHLEEFQKYGYEAVEERSNKGDVSSD